MRVPSATSSSTFSRTGSGGEVIGASQAAAANPRQSAHLSRMLSFISFAQVRRSNNSCSSAARWTAHPVGGKEDGREWVGLLKRRFFRFGTRDEEQRLFLPREGESQSEVKARIMLLENDCRKLFSRRAGPEVNRRCRLRKQNLRVGGCALGGRAGTNPIMKEGAGRWP